MLDVLHDMARREREVLDGEHVEGERDRIPVRGPSFRCGLFVTEEREDPTRAGSRIRRRATLLCAPTDAAGAPLGLEAADELLVTSARHNRAAGLAADAEQRWQVDGDPLVLGAPGEPPIGLNAAVVRVEG